MEVHDFLAYHIQIAAGADGKFYKPFRGGSSTGGNVKIRYQEEWNTPPVHSFNLIQRCCNLRRKYGANFITNVRSGLGAHSCLPWNEGAQILVVTASERQNEYLLKLPTVSSLTLSAEAEDGQPRTAKSL
jgi:hypothetical protein